MISKLLKILGNQPRIRKRFFSIKLNFLAVGQNNFWKKMHFFQILTSLWLMDLWGWCIEEADGSLEGNFPELVEDAGLCEIIDLTRCCVFPGCWACKGLEINGFEIEAVVSAVSKVVGKSMSLWIWIPSPGPICEIWLKLEGAEIILERRSGFLKIKFKHFKNT